MNKGQELYKEAKRLIPGGTQLLSKRPEMFLPDQWPSYYEEALGVEVRDLDGKKFIDMSYMGIGACTLGYSDPDVDDEVVKAIIKGSMCTLNCREEVELAKLLIELHPWAEMVRYARTGGEAMAIAVRIARACSRRNKVAFCGYHGWHDWYLSANIADEFALNDHLLPGLSSRGVPRELYNTTFPFHYNKIDELREIVKKHALGVIVMEPIRSDKPTNNFLEEVREIASTEGAVLIFDEVSSGFRLTTGGAHLLYNVNPDIAVFAKGMSNGYPMAAIIGKREVMEAAQDTFISSTYWTERIGPTAAIATIKKYEKYDVPLHLKNAGQLIQEGWLLCANNHNLDIKVDGIYPLSHFTFNYLNSQAIKTLFTQEMLSRGFLATTAFYPSYAHKTYHINEYLVNVNEVFRLISRAIERNEVEKMLKGPIAQTGFARLT